mgnify:CR=1 FL=1|tara:strand:- start:83 stop:607 length:525 start_codon:yes stop_codon:yes gene_type:complete
MSGSLVLVSETIVSSPVATVSLTGIDTTYDNYYVVFNDVFTNSDDDIQIRVTTSGTADSDSEYDYGSLDLKTSGTYGNTNAANATQFDFCAGVGTSGANSYNGEMYLFNFASATEYSYVTMENVTTRTDTSDELFGFQGGGTHTVAETNDGIHFFTSFGNNITGGTFKMFGIVK